MSNPAYSVGNYGEMIGDRVRMAAYDAALRTVCRPGCRVLDLGAGPGLTTLLACRHGAGHVYAIEPSDVIGLARELADANGMSDRITFIQGLSTEVTLPEQVDIVVADVRGVLPLMGTGLTTMIDARRFLAPGGVLLPARDRIRTALVETASSLGAMIDPWREAAFGFHTSPAEQLVLNSFRKTSLKGDALLTTSETAIELDYATLQDPNAQGSGTVSVMRRGMAHGVAVWFETTLVGDVGFSNEPGPQSLIYGQMFFPLERPASVEPGDTATIVLKAHLVHDDYIWSWEVTVRSGSGAMKQRTSQSSFHGFPLSLEGLRTSDRASRPRLNEVGDMDRFVLDCIDGETALGDIAEGLAQRFPAKFADARSALSHVIGVTTGRTKG